MKDKPFARTETGNLQLGPNEPGWDSVCDTGQYQFILLSDLLKDIRKK